MYKTGGSLRGRDVRSSGDGVGIQPLGHWVSNLRPLSGRGTMSGGEFDWGGRLRKSIGGAKRFPQDGRKPSEECKGIRELDCESDGSSRYESRA